MVNCIYNLPEIDFIGGSSQTLEFNIYFGEHKSPFDLANCTASFAVINFVNRMGSPIITKPMTNKSGKEQILNVLQVLLEPNDTVDLNGKYIYQVSIRDNEGNVEVPQQGIIYIHNNINKDFLKA